MIHKVNVKITIKDLIIIQDIEEVIYEGFLNTSQKCTITIPFLKQAVTQTPVTDLISAGDKIVYERGYNDILFKRFTGYIDDIQQKDKNGNIILTCYDIIYYLDQNWCSFPEYNQMTDNAILLSELSQCNINNNIVSIPFLFNISPTFINSSISNMTKLRLLKTLMLIDSNALNCFYVSDEGILIIEKNFTRINTLVTDLNTNKIIDLNLNKLQDKSLKIRVYVNYTNTEKASTMVEVGNGNVIIDLYEKDIDKSTALIRANEKLLELQNRVYGGDITLFGEPIIYINNSLFINIALNPLIPNIIKADIEAVEETLNNEGIRQVITLKEEVYND